MKKLLVMFMMLCGSCAHSDMSSKSTTLCVTERDVVSLLGPRTSWNVSSVFVAETTPTYIITIVELIHKIIPSDLVKIHMTGKHMIDTGEDMTLRTVLFYKDRTVTYAKKPAILGAQENCLEVKTKLK